MLGIGAGILTLYDVINLNKRTQVEEVQTFFMLMEVYGQSADLSYLNAPIVGRQAHQRQSDDPFEQDSLKTLRMKSLDQLTQVSHALGLSISKLKELPGLEIASLKAPEQAGLLVSGVNENLAILQALVDKVRRYFLAKLKRVSVAQTHP